jgi:SAM-dependent methyltransferase
MTTLRDISGKLVTRFVPQSLRFRLHDAALLQRVAGRTAVDPSQFSADAQARSQSRWRQARPEVDLTWNESLSGRPFVTKIAQHAKLDESTRLLEIGPGYGRLLSAYLEQGLPFASYTGLDLSEQNVAYLTDRFASDPRISFIQGEVSAADVPEFDVCYSSLVFKHFYPTFEPALVNLGRSLSDRGRFVFDLLEGKRTYFEHDDTTYVHCYEPSDVTPIVTAAGLRVLDFDHVEHGPGQIRLLVVAGR